MTSLLYQEVLMNELRQNCAVLTANMLSAMEADNYSYRITHRSVNYIYRALNRFCDDNYEGMYSQQAGKEFLQFNVERIPPLSQGHMRTYRNSITRLDHALTGDYHWKPVSKEKQAYASSCFDRVINEYEKFLYETGKTESDVRARIHVLSRFLQHADLSGVTDLSSFTAEIIYSGFKLERSRDEFCKAVKSFFRYLHRKDFIKTDLSGFVPEYSRHKPIPSVYSVDEVAAILNSIDRNTGIGKRNYCIILIAARLGLRSCDISSLTFENICHATNSIRLVQKKTGEPIVFPLLPEINAALNDYIDNGRPPSDSHYIFLNSPHPQTTPLKPHTVYTIVSRIINRSGIDVAGRRLGAHALRSSLASQLLDEGNSYSVIQKVLGHTSPEAAKAYVRIETEKLRECALPVPEIKSESLLNFLGKAGDDV